MLALALALGACKTVGPNFERPATPTAAGYVMPGEAAGEIAALTPDQRAAGPWWTGLGSADLDKVMGEALAGNRTVAAAEATLQKAQAQVAAERGTLGPQVDAAAGAQRTRINTSAFGFAGFPSPTINLFSVGGTVAYDLDLFGGGRRRVEAAQARAAAEGARADAAYLSLTGNVALAAVRIAGLRAQIEAQQAILDDDRRNLQIAKDAEAAGGEAPSAGVGAAAQLAQDLAVLPPLQQMLAVARHQLALLVGRSPAEWTAPDFQLEALTVPQAVPVALPSQLVRRRPDILAAEADLHAATAQIGVAQAARYPNVSLRAGLTQMALTPGDLFSTSATGWNVGAGLTAPVLHGGTLKANQRAAEAEARASLARYQQTVLSAFVQVADVMTALAQDDEALSALQGAVAAEEASLKDARTAYRLGGGPFRDIVEDQRQVNQARRNLAVARGQKLADVVQLYAATAADWRAAGAAP